jgi:hypothetical protein
MKLQLLVLLAISSIAAAQNATPSVHFSVDPNNLYADGRWVPSKEKSAFPSETQLNCMRQWRSCLAATAETYAGHPHVSIEYFQIVQWDDSGLAAVDADPICMKRTMVISFAGKTVSVSGSVKNVPKEQREACAL